MPLHTQLRTYRITLEHSWESFTTSVRGSSSLLAGQPKAILPTITHLKHGQIGLTGDDLIVRTITLPRHLTTWSGWSSNVVPKLSRQFFFFLEYLPSCLGQNIVRH